MNKLYDCARPTHLWGVWMVPICTFGVFIEDEESGSIAKNQGFTFLNIVSDYLYVSTCAYGAHVQR